MRKYIIQSLLIFLCSIILSCGQLLNLGGEKIPTVGHVINDEELEEEISIIVKSMDVDRGQILLNNSVYFLDGLLWIYPRQEEYISAFEVVEIGDSIILSSNPSRLEIFGKEDKHYVFTELQESELTWYDKWW